MKNTLIVSGVYDLFLKTKKELFLDQKDSYDLSLYLDKMKNIKMDQLEECMKIYKANKQRKYNSWNELCKWYFGITQIRGWKKYKVIFGTLTFKENVLEKTNATTRRKYVQRYLADHTIHYQANIDFGDKKEREHYHFLAMIEEDLNPKDWKYGWTFLEKVKFNRTNLKKIRNYLLKLK